MSFLAAVTISLASCLITPTRILRPVLNNDNDLWLAPDFSENVSSGASLLRTLLPVYLIEFLKPY